MKITLCGSTRFGEAYRDWDVILTKAGHIIYTVARMSQSDGGREPTPEEKRRFDLVHLEKIAASDAIVVLNVDGYYGESTEREIEWARMQKKEVYWLENQTVRPTAQGRALGVTPLGPSVWTIYNLFESGEPIARTIPEAQKYLDTRPSSFVASVRPTEGFAVKGSQNG